VDSGASGSEPAVPLPGNRIIEAGIAGEGELQAIEAVDLVKDDILSESQR